VEEKQVNQSISNTTVIVGAHMRPHKSMGVALLLAAAFGPLGLLYASVTGGIIMLVVDLIVAVVTLGFGLIFMWPIPIIWAAVAINRERERQALAVSHSTVAGAVSDGGSGQNTPPDVSETPSASRQVEPLPSSEQG
jgi:hypothetical protein